MILGDASPAMWAKYVMPVPELVAEPIKRVEEHYFGNSGDEKSQAQGADDAVPSDAQLEVVS